MEGICRRCKLQKTVHRNRRSKKLICYSCYEVARYHDPSTHKRCSGCGNVKPVAVRSEDGKPICRDCYQKPRRAKMALQLNSREPCLTLSK